MSTTKTFTVEEHAGTFKNQSLEDVTSRVRRHDGVSPLVVHLEQELRDFDVFYGSGGKYSGSRDSTGWQGWGQHRTVKATSHHDAAVKALYCNHGNGSRYGIVGEQPETFLGRIRPEKVLRHFEVVHCSAAEAEYTWPGNACVPHPVHIRMREIYI